MYVKNRVSAVLIGVLASGVGFVDDACGGPVYIGRYRELVRDQTQEFSDQGDVGAQRLKNRGRVGAHGLEDEAQERAAVEESWKQEFYERVLGEVRREAKKEILGEMGSDLEELMQEVRKLKALMLASMEESPGPESERSLLPLDTPKRLADVLASLCGEKRDAGTHVSMRYRRDSKGVALFASSLVGNLTEPLLNLKSEKDDVSVLPAEYFVGRNTLFLPKIIYAERDCLDGDSDSRVYSRSMFDDYEALYWYLHEYEGSILRKIQGGAGSPNHRDAIQNWVVDNKEGIINGEIVKRLIGGEGDSCPKSSADSKRPYDLSCQYNLRWLLATALITASEDGDVRKYNVGNYRSDLTDVDPSDYGSQDGPGYTLKTVEALVILLDF
jgi:hypothetical protein